MIPIGTSARPNEISDLNTGMLTVVDSGRKIASRISRMPSEETNVSMDLLENFAPSDAPVKRPISIRNQ